MDRDAKTVLSAMRALLEFTVNFALDTLAPRQRPSAVPVVAMAERAWKREAAIRRRLAGR